MSDQNQDEYSKEVLEALKGIREDIKNLYKKPEPTTPPARTYKCTGKDCGFTTTDPDEYIHHRMGEVYTHQQNLEQKLKDATNRLETLEHPPKPEGNCPKCHTHNTKELYAPIINRLGWPSGTYRVCTDDKCGYRERIRGN